MSAQQLLEAIDSVLDGIVRRILVWLGPWLEPRPVEPRVARFVPSVPRRRVHAPVAPIELPADEDSFPDASERTRISRVHTQVRRREELGLVPLGANELLAPEHTADHATRLGGRGVVVRVDVEEETTVA